MGNVSSVDTEQHLHLEHLNILNICFLNLESQEAPRLPYCSQVHTPCMAVLYMSKCLYLLLLLLFLLLLYEWHGRKRLKSHPSINNNEKRLNGNFIQ